MGKNDGLFFIFVIADESFVTLLADCLFLLVVIYFQISVLHQLISVYNCVINE